MQDKKNKNIHAKQCKEYYTSVTTGSIMVDPLLRYLNNVCFLIGDTGISPQYVRVGVCTSIYIYPRSQPCFMNALFQ